MPTVQDPLKWSWMWMATMCLKVWQIKSQNISTWWGGLAMLALWLGLTLKVFPNLDISVISYV